jgi:apolipoprotein N-acyltransferase
MALLSGLLSGLLIGTSYIPFNGWALLFCYSPLWLGASSLIDSSESTQKLYRQIFAMGWIAQFVLTLIGFNWIFYVSSEFGLLHWSLSAGALLLFAAFMHLYIPFSLVAVTYLVKKFKIQKKMVQFIMLALCLSFFERIWPSIFEWNLAYTLLWIKFPLYQWADTVGFWGLSTWILLFQAFITYGISLWSTERRKTFEVIGLTVLVIVCLTLMGRTKEKKWSHFDQSLQFAVVQGNIGNSEKIQSEKQQNFQSYILKIYTDLTEEQLKTKPETEVIIWPETSMPFALDTFFLNRNEQKRLLSSVQNWNRPLITGGYSVDIQKRDHLGNPLISNSVFYIGTSQNLIGEPYNKTDLLVFGEYMPLGEQLPFLFKLLPFVGVYKKGPGPSTQDIILKDKTVRLGAQICYESLNPGFSRGLAEKGSQILFNVTNDSWFGWWAEPFQHGWMTLGRAIEVRRPLVRSTNTGISTVILANGDVLENSPIAQAWAHTYDVRYLENPPASFYTRVGYLDWIFWLIVFFGLILIYRNKGLHVRN